MPVMRNEASSQVLKVWLYAAASVVLGAWVSPLFYNAGKALAEVSSTKQTNVLLEWFAGLCRAADFPKFFVASLILVAVVLFLPFVEWLQGGRGRDGAANRPWRMRLPDGARPMEGGQRLRKNPDALRHALRGFLVVTVLFLLIGGVLITAGVLEWRSPGGGILKMLAKTAAFAVGLAVLQEIVFRGIAMGIFLRAMRPAAALGMSAVLFARADCEDDVALFQFHLFVSR